MLSRVERHLMSGCCVLAVSLFASHAAKAQQTVENVTITGQSYALQKSIDDKRSNNVVSDGIAADEIGQTPEFGLGDALRQVPGVVLSINNGRGEDEFITIRGLNPDYNTVTIDGMALPSTEETVRSTSLDVIPAVLVTGADVKKTWTVDQPTDAIGGVTDLHTRSAFDHPGEFFGAHLDGAYWTSTEQIKSQQPSGQGDLTYSRTFGDDNEFGFLVQGSYFQRSSNTLNTYTLGYSYYPYSGSGTAANVPALDQAPGATANSTTLKPSDQVQNLVPIPDRHRWYYYDNDRTRPAAFTRLDYNDHGMFHADIEGGFFEFVNNENRWSQYLNRSGNATITSPTTGSFAAGSPEDDFDRFVQYRELSYVQGHAALDFAANTHLDFTFNYGVGQYRQTDDEDQFLGAANSPTYAFSYQLNAPTSALFIPNNTAAFQNPANYSQVYHESVTDQSISHLPQTKLEFNHNTDASDYGFGFKAGWTWRDLSQRYDLTQFRQVPAAGTTAPTLAQIGTINKNLSLYDGEGQTLLLVDPGAVINYVAAHPSAYVENSSDALTSTVNNFILGERIDAWYGEARYRANDFLVIAGLRFEETHQSIQNFLPVPLSSTTNFQQMNNVSRYGRLLPSINGIYDVTDDFKIRGDPEPGASRICPAGPEQFGQLLRDNGVGNHLQPQPQAARGDQLRPFRGMVSDAGGDRLRRPVRQDHPQRNHHPDQHGAERHHPGHRLSGGPDHHHLAERQQVAGPGHRDEPVGCEVRFPAGLPVGFRRQRQPVLHRLRLALPAHERRHLPQAAAADCLIEDGGQCLAALQP